MLTIRGRECLQQADLVLYDGLVNPLLLQYSPALAERTARVSGPDGKRLNQDEINRQLVEAALSGKTVVRLKGGDPYIFGRGTEEAAALREAGVPFEVVPGITAATAAGEYAGISVTHRRLASAVAFVTGHEDPEKAERLDYAALAMFPGTLVFYMGLARLPAIADSLIEHGMDPQTPACVVSRASTTRQQTVTATVESVASAAAAARLPAPSLIIVGQCARQHEALKWFELQPLFGLRIGITRAASQAEPVIRDVVAMGGDPVLMPMFEPVPPASWDEVDSTIDRLSEFDWVAFTSGNAVRFFCDRLIHLGFDARRFAAARIAAVGTSTAACLQDYGLKADVVPEQHNAESLAAAILDAGVDGRLLWPRGRVAKDALPETLSAAGVEVRPLIVYGTRDVPLDDATARAIESGDIDWIGVSSPAVAGQLVQSGVNTAAVRIAAISEDTAATVRELGLEVDAVAATSGWDGILRAIAASKANRHV